MKNIADSQFLKARPDLREKMLEEEQIVRDLIQSAKDGTLEYIGDTDDNLSTFTDLEEGI